MLCVAAFLLRHVFTFEAFAKHRERFVAFRDAHYLASLEVFLVGCTAMVAFSLPGATVASLSGGFLFGLMPGLVINVLAATAGVCMIFELVRAGWGRSNAAELDLADRKIGSVKAGMDKSQVPMLLRLMPLVPLFIA